MNDFCYTAAMVKKVKVGLALGGGAARGLAHIGILQCLQQHNIEIHCVAGTSIGALVGAAYGCGKLEEFSDTMQSITLSNLAPLLSPTVSFNGIFSGKKIMRLMTEVLGAQQVESLQLPYAAIAVDLHSGQPVVFTEGPLAEVVRCSISIPVLFTPYPFRNSIFIDGGVVDPVPIAAARALGADVVIAVDLFGSIESIESLHSARQHYQASVTAAELGSVMGILKKFRKTKDRPPQVKGYTAIAERTLAIAQHHATKTRLEQNPANVLLRPPLGHVGLFDFHRCESLIRIGLQAMEEQIHEVTSVLSSYD